MKFELAAQVTVIIVACLVGAVAFRARIAKATSDAQHTAIDALQDAIAGLEHKLRIQEERHQSEIAVRDRRISALEAEMAAIKLNVGIEALIEIKEHVDTAADRIVQALQEDENVR